MILIMNNVYFSPGEDCKAAIIEQIQKAQSTIKICVFTISDNEISNHVINAHKKGIDVTIITDDDKIKDKGSDIKLLFREGIEIRTDDSPSHMHHKFALIDNQILITGSFNWTRSASERNQENVIVTDNEELVAKHVSYYHELWNEMKRFY